MSLVNYDYEDSGDDENECDNSTITTTNSNNQLKTDQNNDVTSIEENKICTSNQVNEKNVSKPTLHDPVNSFLPKSFQNVSSSLTKETVKKTKAGRIQIAVPSINLLNQVDSEEDSDEDSKRHKRMKKSDKGSHLLSLLPKPKNEFGLQQPTSNSNTPTLTTTSLIPNSVVNRTKARLPVPTKVTSDIKINSELLSQSANKSEQTSENSNFFFNYNDDDDDDDADIKIPFEDNLKQEISTLPSTSFNHDAPVYGPAKPELVDDSEDTFDDIVQIDPNDDITYKKFIASKFGEEGAQDIKIVDVDMSKHVAQNKEWLKNITLENPEQEDEDETNLPNSTARRKHQITFLAYQAKKREVELKNQWAQNRLSKAQTKAKYGF